MNSEEELLANMPPAHRALRQFFRTNLSDFTLGASLAKAEDPNIYVGMDVKYDQERSRIVPLRFKYLILPPTNPAAIIFQVEGDKTMIIMPTVALEVDPSYHIKTLKQWMECTNVRPM